MLSATQMPWRYFCPSVVSVCYQPSPLHLSWCTSYNNNFKVTSNSTLPKEIPLLHNRLKLGFHCFQLKNAEGSFWGPSLSLWGIWDAGWEWRRPNQAKEERRASLFLLKPGWPLRWCADCTSWEVAVMGVGKHPWVLAPSLQPSHISVTYLASKSRLPAGRLASLIFWMLQTVQCRCVDAWVHICTESEWFLCHRPCHPCEGIPHRVTAHKLATKH